jgi:hypothetical protein
MKTPGPGAPPPPEAPPPPPKYLADMAEEQLITLGAIETVLQQNLATQAVDAFHDPRDQSSKSDEPQSDEIVRLLQSVCDEVGVNLGTLNWAGVLDDQSDTPIATLPPLPAALDMASGDLFALPPSVAIVSETTPDGGEECAK